MPQILALVILMPLILWSTFQPMLFHNASLTKQTIKIALYEVNKKAAIQGKYDEDLYAEFKDTLAKNHGYNPNCIQIKGTEELTPRGEELKVTVTIPKPLMSFWDMFSIESCERPESYTPYFITHSIQSEYVP